MGAFHKQAYQQYLKSEHWAAQKNTVIEQTQGFCCVCFFQSALNDVHHIVYPADGWYKTLPHHLTTLCRRCHSRVHELLGDFQPSKPSEGFKKFYEIRDRLRSEDSATVNFIAANSELARVVSRRCQKAGYEWRPGPKEKRAKIKSMKTRLGKLTYKQVRQVEAILRHANIS